MKELTPSRTTSITAASALLAICSIYLPKEFQIYILKKLYVAQNLETSFLSEERTEEKKAPYYNC
jgi:hypothetical protein